jgi:hypothetical protein
MASGALSEGSDQPHARASINDRPKDPRCLDVPAVSASAIPG